MEKLGEDIFPCKGCREAFYEWDLNSERLCKRCEGEYLIMVRTEKYSKDGNELIKINCKKCGCKQGVRKRGSLKVFCIDCNYHIGEFQF